MVVNCRIGKDTSRAVVPLMKKKKEEEEEKKKEEGEEEGRGGEGGEEEEEKGEEVEEEEEEFCMCKLLLFCSLAFCLATAVQKFNLRFVTNRTPNK
jgi:hypothetical protein